MILQLLEHNLVLRGYDPAKIIPGKISTEKYECVIPLEENSAKFWRAAITKMYNDIVTESKGGDEKKERRNSVLERRKSMATNVRKHSIELGITEKDFERLNKMHQALNNESLDKMTFLSEKSHLKIIKVHRYKKSKKSINSVLSGYPRKWDKLCCLLEMYRGLWS